MGFASERPAACVLWPLTPMPPWTGHEHAAGVHPDAGRSPRGITQRPSRKPFLRKVLRTNCQGKLSSLKVQGKFIFLKVLQITTESDGSSARPLPKPASFPLAGAYPPPHSPALGHGPRPGCHVRTAPEMVLDGISASRAAKRHSCPPQSPGPHLEGSMAEGLHGGTWPGGAPGGSEGERSCPPKKPSLSDPRSPACLGTGREWAGVSLA